MAERMKDRGEEHQAAQHNPDWTRDELILALDLYFRMAPKVGTEAHPEIIALSSLLGDLPIHTMRHPTGRFRNPAGVAMKLNNFRRLDTAYGGRGLSHGAKADREVWDEFAHNREHLHAVAAAIRACMSSREVSSPSVDQGEYEAVEGEVLYRQHRVYERDRSLVTKKKEQALKLTGALRCEACGLSFPDMYGDLGEGYIECHHTVPVSQLRPGRVTKLMDLVLVCPNCHRMLHRGRQGLSIDELKRILQSVATKARR